MLEEEDINQEDFEKEDEIDLQGGTFRVRRKGYSKKNALSNAHKAAKRKAGNRPYKVIEERTYAEQNYWVGVVGGQFLDKD